MQKHREQMRYKISDLASLELTEAIKHYGHFTTVHEMASVLREEIEEVGESFEDLKSDYDYLWKNIRKDLDLGDEMLNCIEREALHLAYEAIQVVAMCRKGKMFIKGEK